MEYEVVWPLDRHHYLTMWEGYVSALDPRHHQSPMNCRRGTSAFGVRRDLKLMTLLTLAGIPADYVLRGRYGPNKSKCMRVFSVASYGREWMRPNIVRYLNESRQFSDISNVQRAVDRVLMTDVDYPLGILSYALYRERHKPWQTLTGDNAPNRKLTSDQVNEIRERYANEEPRPSHKRLGYEYGVSSATISGIVGGGTWKHV